MQAIWNNDWSDNLAKIAKPVDRTEWDVSAATINAYYSALKNQLVLPAAILQPPMFNESAHPAQNFGAIGAVIGNELIHGFEGSGRYYDASGNFRDWWSEATAKEFESRATCMEEQYSKFGAVGNSGKIVGYVDGNLTLGENIADNGGVSLSFDAYHAWLESGAKFNSNGVTDDEADKLFFVSFGQVWCNKIRDEALNQQLSDVHSPGMWRVNGVAMNSDAFADTFKCKPGSKMNPTTKCKVWQT